jgi:hypothetical protein
MRQTAGVWGCVLQRGLDTENRVIHVRLHNGLFSKVSREKTGHVVAQLVRTALQDGRSRVRFIGIFH